MPQLCHGNMGWKCPWHAMTILSRLRICRLPPCEQADSVDMESAVLLCPNMESAILLHPSLRFAVSISPLHVQ